MTIDLDKLEAALAKATPGPWRVGEFLPVRDQIADGEWYLAVWPAEIPPPNESGTVVCLLSMLSRQTEQDITNAALIVAAINALPALIARIREQDKAIAAADAMKSEYMIAWKRLNGIGKPGAVIDYDRLRGIGK